MWINQSDPEALLNLIAIPEDKRKKTTNKKTPTTNKTTTPTNIWSPSRTTSSAQSSANQSDPEALLMLRAKAAANRKARREEEKYKSRTITDFNTEAKTAYTSAYDKSKSKTTIKSDLTEDERKKRIKEIDSELRTLNTQLHGYGRAKAYGTSKAMVEAEQKVKDRIALLAQERKTLERTGTFTASELKQFEIEDARAKKNALPVYNPTARVAPSSVEAYKKNIAEHSAVDKEIDLLKRQKELYDDIADYGDVVLEETNDAFGDAGIEGQPGFINKMATWGHNAVVQSKANFRNSDLSREADKAFAEYIRNPTEENLQIAMAYDAFSKEYAKNNKEALDDEGAVATWLTKDFAGYLPQLRDQALPELIGGVGGLIVGGAMGVPNVGWSVGSGLGSYSAMYDVTRGSVYRTLLAEGVDEGTALQAANDEALVSALIEGGGTALSWLIGGGNMAWKAVGTAAKTSVAKGSTNAAVKFVANMAGKATNRAAEKAASAVTRPLWNKAIRVGGRLVGGGLSEYGEEFTQGAVSVANREQAYATVDEELGEYGAGNINLHNRPTYKNEDGSISTVDSVLYQIDDKFVLLPTIARDENGNVIRLETDEEILAHFRDTGEFLGEFDTQEEANAYATKLHTAQAYRYGNQTGVTADDNLWSGGAKAVKSALSGDNPELFSELHEQGNTGFAIGIMMGGTSTAVNTIITNYANAKTVELREGMVDTIIEDDESLTALIEEGKASGEGTVSERIATEIETARANGKDVTRNQVKKLIESTEVYIKAEKNTAPKAKSTARGAYHFADTENADDVSKATGFGKSGAEVVIDYAKAKGKSQSEVANDIKAPYFAGFTEPEMDVAQAESSFDDSLKAEQRQAFLAGQLDRKMQDVMRDTKSQNAKIYDGTFTENENTKNFSNAEKRLISTVARSLGMDIATVDKILVETKVNGIKIMREANASHDGGKMEISNNRDADKAIFRLVLHEGGHRMAELAPKEFGALMNELYAYSSRANEKAGRSQTSGLDNVKSDYAGLGIDTFGFFEEFAVQEIENIFGSEHSFNRWQAQISTNPDARTAWEKIVDYVFSVIDDIKRALSQAKMTKTERAEANAQLDCIKELYGNAYKAAESAVAEKRQSAETNSANSLENNMNEEYNRNESYALRAQRGAGVGYSLESEELNNENRGDLLSDGSGKRKDRKSSRKPAKGLDGRTSRYREGRTTAYERREYCRTLKAAGNTKQEVIHGHQCEVIPEEHYTDRMRKIAELNKERGFDETVFITGKATIPFVKDSKGNSKTARGVLIDSNGKKTVIVQYDNEFATPEQINDHEQVHNTYRDSKTQKAKNIILNSLSAVEKKRVLEKLSRDYRGIIEGNEEQIIEEFIANVLSGQGEYAPQFNDLTRAYWNDNPESLDIFEVSEYTELIDSGGSTDVLDDIGFGNENSLLVKDNTDYVFPPFNEYPYSDANEHSTRWAHREDINEFTKRIMFFVGVPYLIEKDTALPLKYRIVKAINEEDKSAAERFIGERTHNNERVTGEQSRGERTVQDSKHNRRQYSYGLGDVDDRYSVDKHSEETEKFQTVGGQRYSKRNSADKRGRAVEQGIRNKSFDTVKYSLELAETDTEEVTPERKKDVRNVNYSLNKWHTDLSKNDLIELMDEIRYDIRSSKNAITDEANWLFTDIGGKSVFAIYSTDNYKDPTLLYESKGKKAEQEHNILLNLLEETKNGESVDGKSAYVNWVSGGGWMQKVNGIENSIGGMHTRNGGTGNVAVLQGKSSTYGSQAFRNVIKNLIEVSSRGRRIPGGSDGGLNGGNDLSLKGTLSDTEIRNAISNNKLHRYVDKGIITTEKYNELVETYGAIPNGERPHREVQVPKKTAKDKKVSQTVRTILEAKATPDEAVPTIEKMVEDGVFSYDVYTDKQAIEDSDSYIKEYGWDESLDDWFNAVNKGEVSKQITAMGWALYNNAANIAATTTSETERTTAIKTSLKILDAMVRHQRSAAQALQATRILKSLSPETQLYGVQKSVQALQNELSDKYGDKAPDIQIDEELAEQFINAKTPEERAEIEKEIYQDIGRQMPSRFVDKWNAWRYLSMLGNVRTHDRNIIGNAGFAPVVIAKDLTATAIESIVNRVSTKKVVRGKALITGNKADRILLKSAWADYSNVADMISNGGKYNDSAMANKHIEEGRQIFKLKPLEWARKKNSELLEKEDMWFARPHYAYALAQYCKANNITAEQIKRGKAIAPAREYAIKEAQKATYRDTNAFSQMVSEWGRNTNNSSIAKKAISTVIEGILPFRKTPANILVRGIEYSPFGLLKGLSHDLYKVSKGELSASEAIDNISAGLTGTGLLALGVFLAAQGLIRGHGEDDKDEKEFKELMGHQSYALELPNGQSTTLDWLAPEALPFFVGVNIWEATQGSGEEVNLSTILQAVSRISEPMLEMSCLQSLNDLFEGIGYASSNDTSGLVSVISSAVTSYLTQGIPTLLGQAERTGEEYRMTTYTEKNGFLTSDMQYTLGKASAKIPFWDYSQIPYIDAWGRKEASGTALKRGLNNFLNPAYTSTVESSRTEKELLRLYESTGEAKVFPQRADKYFMVDGKRKDLTADEYVKYATLKGNKSLKVVDELMQSNAYKSLDDGEKVKAIAEAYDYANQKAKESISNYKPDTWVKKADEFDSAGDYLSFRANVKAIKEENGDKISKQEVVDAIRNSAPSDSDAWNMYLSMYGSAGDTYAYNNGIDGETYMNYLDVLDRYDKPSKNGNYGTYTQEEARNAVNSIEGLSRQEKAVLWQSVNTNWKRNPFG